MSAYEEKEIEFEIDKLGEPARLREERRIVRRPSKVSKIDRTYRYAFAAQPGMRTSGGNKEKKRAREKETGRGGRKKNWAINDRKSRVFRASQWLPS